MPITIDGLLFGNWEYQYKKKDPEIDKNGNKHYWYAMGHDKESFDDGLIKIGAYEEYYGTKFNFCFIKYKSIFNGWLLLTPKEVLNQYEIFKNGSQAIDANSKQVFFERNHLDGISLEEVRNEKFDTKRYEAGI